MEPEASSVMQACEAFYMNGTPDETSGDVDSPTGHFYRCDRWIVRTDSQGFKDLYTFANWEDAQSTFQKWDNDYSDWSES